MADPFIVRVRQTIQTHRLLSPESRVVIAVSGGADSVVLLHVLSCLRSEWRLTLHLAHLDHGLRPESGDDAEFVRDLAGQWRVPATVERREVSAICARHGWSIEDGARRIRYRFFWDVATQQHATHVALAHTADDQAETVLMRVIRGTGLMGLGGMPIQRPLEETAESSSKLLVIRPLLEVWRQEILAYVTQQQLNFRDDSTNADRVFLRNRIRHELLPLLERDYNPNIKRALTQLADHSHSDYRYLQAATRRQWKRIVRSNPFGEVTIARRAFLRQPMALQRQLVRQVIQQVKPEAGQFEFRHWVEIERLFSKRPVGTVLDLPGQVRLRREGDRIICQPSAPTSDALDANNGSDGAPRQALAPS